MLILNPVDGLYPQGESQATWLSKTQAQNVGALSRFSAGISLSSPRGQKEMINALNLGPKNAPYVKRSTLELRPGDYQKWKYTP
jgi:hypothetical protein